jgi:hypothetical protein
VQVAHTATSTICLLTSPHLHRTAVVQVSASDHPDAVDVVRLLFNAMADVDKVRGFPARASERVTVCVGWWWWWWWWMYSWVRPCLSHPC